MADHPPRRPACADVLEQFRESQYQPQVRSPLNIALAKGVNLGDFVLDVEVRSTGRDYGHRDLCLFFNHQDSSHFYYVHLGKQANAAANSIFRVNGKPRISIAEKRTQGTPWTDGWHHVRIVRTVQDGLIQVYFDDMKTPAMIAHDRTFTHGRLGLGSFDDTGMFDAIRIRGKKGDSRRCHEEPWPGAHRPAIGSPITIGYAPASARPGHRTGMSDPCPEAL